MLNIDDFTKRLKKILDHYNESASSFAEHIGVQRSSISHILSGRNKPSLDFILKIINNYPEVELYWLLNGKGQFPIKDDQNKDTDNSPDLFKEVTSVTNNDSIPEKNQNLLKGKSNHSEIERIVIFFKNGSFINYEQ